jgi:hypothetical protein
MTGFVRSLAGASVLATLLVLPTTGGAATLGIVHADHAASAAAAQAGLLATGAFTSVSLIDATVSTPTVGTLSSFDFVLVYTNLLPASATALGNVLADFYDLGGKGLTLATYGFSSPWAIEGRITTGDYVGLTNTGTNGSVSGSLVATVPSDPVFAGLDLSAFIYQFNSNFAHPGVAGAATLLATDGAGHNMIARSLNGVVNVNLYPGSALGAQNADFYRLLANTFQSAPQVPEPGLLALLGLGTLTAVRRLRRTIR